jgi:hypothetical protein
MKKVLLLIALAAATPVSAQAPEPANESATRPATEAKAPAKSTGARKSRRTEDARHCLQLPSNTEIIICAEAYL